ncbi:alpha/beta fold hydrolase [Candidatus Woesearchaeota archaeon]|nr:alpha/beta fold hydrolase [Candidatus Woesearchaeota archaeon]
MEKKVHFLDSEGHKVCGILSNPFPSDVVVMPTVIILCHGFASSKNNLTHTTLVPKLHEAGIASLRIDFFGHGESEGKFEDITISRAVNDILSAISYLKSLSYSKIGLCGSSFGGISSIMAASKTYSLEFLALKSPVSDYYNIDRWNTPEELAQWKTKGSTIYKTGNKKLNVKYSFFEDIANNQGYKAAEKIKIPTLIVHGDKDVTVPVEQSRKTSKIIENCQLEIIHGADHKYSEPQHFSKMMALIFNFLLNQAK